MKSKQDWPAIAAMVVGLIAIAITIATAMFATTGRP